MTRRNRMTAAALLAAALAIGACNPPRRTADTMPGAPPESAGSLRLGSRAFGNGAEIPRRHTCEGDDPSPPLAWNGAPAATRSLALVVHDPDAPDPAAPRVDWVHWIVYDLPPAADSLGEGASRTTLPAGAREGTNDWSAPGWRGPCPPVGRHRYVFELFALDTVLADLGAPNRAALEKAIAGHVLARATLTGTYQKHDAVPPPATPPAVAPGPAATAGFVTGTVRHQDLEGGFFGIVADDSTRYDPLDLPEEFRVDGMRIRFRPIAAPGALGTHMWGTIVHVTEVAKTP